MVKGWMGFGDRLESLKMCVKYAQTHNLQIYVDWGDQIWTHGSENFYTYFKIVNMPILNSLNDIPADATFFPKYWTKQNIDNSLSHELINKINTIGINVDINDMDTNADVLVYSCLRDRSLFRESEFFSKVFRVINTDVLSGLQKRLSMVPLSTAIGIHARGTDRAKNDIRKEQSIQFMALNARPFESRKMIAVGDDSYSIELWKRFYPNTMVFTSLAQNSTTNKGNHLVNKDELKNSKYDLTVEFLVDFFTLCYCERVLSTFKDSRFAQEARRLHPYVRQMVGNE